MGHVYVLSLDRLSDMSDNDETLGIFREYDCALGAAQRYMATHGRISGWSECCGGDWWESGDLRRLVIDKVSVE